MTTKLDILDHLDELSSFYMDKVEKINQDVNSNMELLNALKEVEFQNKVAPFMEKLTSSLEGKTDVLIEHIKRFSHKIKMVNAFELLLNSLEFTEDIFKYNSTIEENGTQVVREIREFTKQEFLDNLKELERHRKEVLADVKRIVYENDITLKELKNKTWSKEGKPLFDRMIERLEVMNKQQRPEIQKNQKVLTAVRKLMALIKKEERATLVLNTMLAMYGE